MLHARGSCFLALMAALSFFCSNPLPAIMMLPIASRRVAQPSIICGSSVGDLKVDTLKASGSFGKLLLCSTRWSEKVAVKSLKSKKIADFLGEGLSLIENFNHQNLLKIQEIFVDPVGNLHIVMPFLEGKELFDLAGKLTGVQVADIFHKVAGAVSFIHRRGFAHRDIKPENIMISPAQEPVLVDLGSLRALDTVAFTAGTKEYMPPKIFGSKTCKVEPRLDTWSLGICACSLILNTLIGSPVEARWRALKISDPVASRVVESGAALLENARLSLFASNVSFQFL